MNPLIDKFLKTVKIEQEKCIKEKPCIGWTNTYIPEEIILAAGFMPYRVMGTTSPLSKAKTYLSGNPNPYIQSCLECALKGEYNFLKGVIIGGTTDAAKRLYDAWVHFVKMPFVHLFDIPKITSQNALERYKESVIFLIKSIEECFNIKIAKTSIIKAISICNETRRLLSRLNDLRKFDNPLISSNDFLEISKLAMTSPKGTFNKELTTLLEKILSLPENSKDLKPRLLLTGSFQNHPWLVETIEEMGGLVVCEDMCTRFRYFHGLVDTTYEPILAITKRYMDKSPSARMVDFKRRAEYLYELIKEFKVDAVIYYILKFDDPYLFEFPDVKEFLDSKNIPVLRIETDHTTGSVGQIKTRVQAFIETLNVKLAV